MGYPNTAMGEQNETRMPELGRLKAATERLFCATGKLDAFLFRFNGPRLQGEAASGQPSPPDHYRNDLESLFRQINELEERVATLDEIG